MDRERWREIRAIFEAVVDLDPEARSQALDDRCAGSDEIRREVESLLEAHQASPDPLGDTAIPETIDRYRIVRPLGSGGMGTVYLARQEEPIRRDVAIKLIRDGGESQNLLQRFQAERQALASLSHQNIAGVLDAGSTDDGRPYFVMEYVPGSTITDYCREHRLDRTERLNLLIQLCDALEHAHASGIVHRDIKPSNVIVMSQDGRPLPKIIDFGVAKAADLFESEETPQTVTGQLLGTPAYMSPEQARGRPVDARADLWALGCLIFELESGEPPFRRDNLGDTLVAVLSTEVDLSLLPPETPAAVHRLLRRCLAKDPELRLASAADARLELTDALAESSEVDREELVRRRRGVGTLLPWVGLVIVAIVALGIGRGRDSGAPDLPSRKLRFDVPGLQRADRSAPVISPDGTAFVHVREGALWIRRLDSLEAAPFPETEGAEYPFWSPDSRSIGFFARGYLWTVPAGGGETTRVYDLRGDLVGGAGAVWTEDGAIVYSRGNTDLFSVPARGGERTTRFECASEVGEHVHGPTLLPDGRSLVFVVHRTIGADTIGVLSGDEFEVILRMNRQRIGRILWSSTGHLILERRPLDAGVWAIPFSPETREVGTPFLLATDGGFPSVSSAGTLLYVPAAIPEQMQLGWVGLDGEWQGTAGTPDRQLRFPRLSPDGQLVAATHRSQNSYDVWVQDLESGARSRLNFEPGFASWAPAWSPNGEWIIGHKDDQSPDAPAAPRLWLRRSDGSGSPRDLGPGWSACFSRDGLAFLYGTRDEDIGYAPLDRPDEKTRLVAGEGEEREPEVSPNGTLVAYVSNENDIWEITLTTFPEGDGKWQVSRGGGSKPRWSERGDRLYFVSQNTMYEVEVSTDPAVRVSVPRPLFEGDDLELLLDEGYDFDSERSRFIVIREIRPPGSEDSAVLFEGWSRR